MEKDKEYELLMQLELETTKIRHTTFTALVSISFVLPGLALSVNSPMIDLYFFTVSLSKFVFFFGFLFYTFAVYHYKFYHHYSHMYRKVLKELEKKLRIEIYKNRLRPQWHLKILKKEYNLKFHFEWALYIIWWIYLFITGFYVGWLLSISLIVFIVILYSYLLYRTRNQPVEREEV